MISRNGILVYDSVDVTGLYRTSDIVPGMNVFGTKIQVDTKVSSVESSTAIKLTKPAKITGTEPLVFTSMSADIYLEQLYALTDIKGIVDERGMLIKVVLRKESNVTRDRYNSIEARQQDRIIWMKAYPVNFSPSMKQLEKAGIREQANVLAYTAMKDWMTAGVELDEIEFEGRSTVVLQGKEYEIRERGQESQIGDSFAYITLGLFKR
jgi:hypothetical protein